MPYSTLPAPGPIARRAAAEALANVGVHEEGGPNRGKYVEIYQASTVPPLHPGDAWCAAMVTYRLRNAAHDLNSTLPADFCRSGYVPDWRNWARENGMWVPQTAVAVGQFLPKAGDLCVFYFANLARVAHIGFVVHDASPGSTSFMSVEGNTSAMPGSGVDRDADGVYEKSRTCAQLGSGGGFIRVPY